MNRLALYFINNSTKSDVFYSQIVLLAYFFVKLATEMVIIFYIMLTNEIMCSISDIYHINHTVTDIESFLTSTSIFKMYANNLDIVLSVIL